MRLTAGAIPHQPLLITVTDGSSAVDLSDFDPGVVQLELTSPTGQPISTAGGALSIDEEGRALYAWPTTSLFPTPGDYRLRIRLQGTGLLDFTTTATIEVYP